jgi:lysophospholipase L1-like esterase
MGVYTVTGLANTVHQIEIRRVSGNVQIMAAEVQSATSGVRIFNGGISSAVVSSLADTGLYSTVLFGAAATSINSDLIFLMTEINDATAGTAVATYKSQMQTAITSAKTNGASVVLVTSAPSSAADVTLYTKALYELADSNDLPLIDLQDLLGSYAAANALGLYNDGTHPNAAGNSVIARAVIKALGI